MIENDLNTFGWKSPGLIDICPIVLIVILYYTLDPVLGIIIGVLLVFFRGVIPLTYVALLSYFLIIWLVPSPLQNYQLIMLEIGVFGIFAIPSLRGPRPIFSTAILLLVLGISSYLLWVGINKSFDMIILLGSVGGLFMLASYLLFRYQKFQVLQMEGDL